MEFYESLHSLSDEEEAWVEKLLDQWEAVEKDKAAELGSAQAQDQRDVLGEASAEKDTMTGDAMSTPDVILRSDVSQRGRKRTKKWFGDDFGRFDDDCYCWCVVRVCVLECFVHCSGLYCSGEIYHNFTYITWNISKLE